MSNVKLLMMAAQALADEQTRKTTITIAFIPLLCVLLILAAPVAIFFAIFTGNPMEVSAEPTGSVQSVVMELRGELEQKIAKELEITTGIDKTVLVYMNSQDNQTVDNSEAVLAVYGVMASHHAEEPEPVALLDPSKLPSIESIYWKMNRISSRTEWQSELNEQGEEITIVTKYVFVECLTADEAADLYGFNEEQRTILEEMMSERYAQLREEAVGHSLALTPLEIAEIRAMVGDTSELRLTVVEAAYQLRGKVPYFWNGKYPHVGWKPNWNTPRQIDTPGNERQIVGSYWKDGLDCSGYCDWVWVNALQDESALQAFGSGGYGYWSKSYAVAWEDALPGDVLFLAKPGTVTMNHFGIVVGRDENGTLMAIHCAGGRANGVVVTTARGGSFTMVRRPYAYGD
ncbi:hypothetical protein LJC20_05150 [Eubacteriales bacterium OttesenSCG-928-M02]|nr:hypothetical protein [Eubacteriales bacterium OttesenSCG-928-M02]